MIFKPYPTGPRPHGRIDNVIYYFAGFAVAQPLTLVGWDQTANALYFWDGSSFVVIPVVTLVAGVYPAGDGSLITNLTAANITGLFPIAGSNVIPNFGNQFLTVTGGGTIYTQDPSQYGLRIVAPSGISRDIFDVLNEFGLNLFSVGQPGVGSRFGVPVTEDLLADLLIQASSASQKALVVEAAASQTANVFEVQDSTGTVLFYIDGNNGFGSVGRFVFSNASMLVVPSFLFFGTLNRIQTPIVDDTSADNMFTASAAGRKVLVLQDVSGQTANILEYQDYSGAVLFSVDPTGAVFANGGVTPPYKLLSGQVMLDGTGTAVVNPAHGSAFPVVSWASNTGVGVLSAIGDGDLFTVQSNAFAADAGNLVNWLVY